MTLTTAILTALLHLTPWAGDRTDAPADRATLLRPVAEAIDDASRGDSEIAAALVSLGFHETGFARYVIEGRCEDGPPGARCDPDAHGRARATGPFQVWRWCSEAWDAPAGSRAATFGGARCAVRMLTSASSRCGKTVGDQWLGGFAGYRSAGCRLLDARARVRTMNAVRGELERSRREFAFLGDWQ